MKTLLIALSLFAGSFFTNANAAEVFENPQVTAAFEARFGGATDVRWTESSSLYKVRFTLDGTVSNAWYTAEGGLVAITRQVSPDSLPLALRNSLRAGMNGRWISDVVVMETELGKTWYVTLEDADRQVVLESTAGGKWTRYGHTTKL